MVLDATVAKMLVEVELVAWKVVAKNEVVVAFVEVELSAVKFWSVVEPSVWKFVEKRLVAVSAVELPYVALSRVPSKVRLLLSVTTPSVVTYGTRLAVSDETVRLVVLAVPK